MLLEEISILLVLRNFEFVSLGIALEHKYQWLSPAQQELEITLLYLFCWKQLLRAKFPFLNSYSVFLMLGRKVFCSVFQKHSGRAACTTEAASKGEDLWLKNELQRNASESCSCVCYMCFLKRLKGEIWDLRNMKIMNYNR